MLVNALLGLALALSGCANGEANKISADGMCCTDAKCIMADTVVKCSDSHAEMKAEQMICACKCGSMKASECMKKCTGCGRKCVLNDSQSSKCSERCRLLCKSCAAKSST